MRFVEGLLPPLVDARGGLVQQQDVRPSDQSDGHEEPLKLSAGEGADGLVGELGSQPHHVEREPSLVVRGARHAGLGAEQVLPGDREVAFDVELLRHVSQPGAFGPADSSFGAGARRPAP